MGSLREREEEDLPGMTWAAFSVKGKAHNWKVPMERMAIQRPKKQMYVNDILYSRDKDRFVNI